MIKKIAPIIFIIPLLFGCTNNTKTETICAPENNNKMTANSKVTIKSTGNKITNLAQITTTPVGEYSDSELQDWIDNVSQHYSEYKAITYKSEIKGTTLTETITVNVKKADTETLAILGLNNIDINKDKDKTVIIELDSTIKELEKENLKCETK